MPPTSEHVLLGITAVVGLGIAAQWLAWRLRLPAILLLLLTGFVAGPISGWWRGGRDAEGLGAWLAPDDIFGPVLFPLVSLSVAIILFEGGLTLKFSEFKVVGKAVRNLVTFGALINWILLALGAGLLLPLDWKMSILLGAMLTVTGPTVIGPLLRQVRPKGLTGTALKWEGILIDPIGAVLAVLCFEAILATVELTRAGFVGAEVQAEHVGLTVAMSVFFTLLDGFLIGGAAAALLVLLFNRWWIPDWLHSPVTLVFVITSFALSNHLQEESGLLAVTVMGILLANQKYASITHIIEFKENLRVLLISILFILLSARLEWEVIERIGWAQVAFVGVVIFIARPVSVWLSTFGTGLDWKQRTLLGLIAPRGIVAASIASLFAIKLQHEDYPGADQLVPTVFLVIVGTITFSSLLAGPIARLLGQSVVDPQGVLLVGAQAWARAVALALQKEGIDVMLVDTNRRNTQAARMAGLESLTGTILSESVEATIDLSRFSKLLAVTSNDEANALAVVHMVETFGRREVYQLAPQPRDQKASSRVQVPEDRHSLTGRFWVDRSFGHRNIEERLRRGAEIRATKLTEEFDWADYQAHHGERAVPLFLITNAGKLRVFTASDSPKPSAGNTVLALVDPDEPEQAVATEEAAALIDDPSDSAMGRKLPG